MSTNGDVDPDDYFSHTRMSFGDHIEVLRAHLIRAIAGFLVGMVIAMLFAKFVMGIITSPVEKQLMEFYDRRVEKVAKRLADDNPDMKILDKPKEMPYFMTRTDAERLGWKVDHLESEGDLVKLPIWVKPLSSEIILAAAQRQVGRPPMLSTMNVMEAFMVWCKVAAMTGLVISSPWVFYQLWSFIAAGLYPHEKKYVHRYLPFSIVLFIAGVLLCQFMVIPKAISALLWFNEWLDLEPELRLNEWLGFAILLPLVFGISFQTPLVMLFFGKLGIMDADSFRRKRRIAWFVIAIFAAIVTPSDPWSMILLMIPMWGLYELGILMVAYTAPPPSEVGEDETADELVEV
jgi:sec-independent protein translocase protein TatC